MHPPAARRCTNYLQGQCDITMTIDEWDGNLSLSISESNPNTTGWMVQNVEIAPPRPSIRHSSNTTRVNNAAAIPNSVRIKQGTNPNALKVDASRILQVMRNRSSPTIGAFCSNLFSMAELYAVLGIERFCHVKVKMLLPAPKIFILTHVQTSNDELLIVT
jgi:hypothetical protein